MPAELGVETVMVLFGMLSIGVEPILIQHGNINLSAAIDITLL